MLSLLRALDALTDNARAPLQLPQQLVESALEALAEHLEQLGSKQTDAACARAVHTSVSLASRCRWQR